MSFKTGIPTLLCLIAVSAFAADPEVISIHGARRDAVKPAAAAAAEARPEAANPAYIKWLSDPNSAMKSAEQADKPVMADFTTEWCGWCKKLDKDTYSDPKVIELSRKFVCVKVDGDVYKGMCRQYGITGFPTIIYMTPEGKVIQTAVGYRKANMMTAEMQQALQKYKGAK